MSIERVSNLTKADFIESFLKPGVPVVVSDGMKNWDLNRFTPESLTRDFGEEDVQVYDDLFGLQDVIPLRSYLKNHFNKKISDPRSKLYVRWYTKLKDVDFVWSDHVFDRLKDAWNHPYFIPNSSLIVPFCPNGHQLSPIDSQFPYKGLFISGRGARTRLHRDPWNSSAVLCQLFGKKKIYLYDREQTNYVTNGKEFVDVLVPDLAKFPNFPKATRLAELTLSPGEMVFFPWGTFHDVTSETDSVSITWNFLSDCNLEEFCNHVRKYPDEGELQVVKYFLKNHIATDASAEDIIRFATSKVSGHLGPSLPNYR